jgi:nitrous oxidase accessory protein NosD
MFLLAFVAFVSVPRTSSTSSVLLPVATARVNASPFVSALDWLPRNPVRDGSVDYTLPMQSALDAAAGGTLILPDFPVRVSKRPGVTHCLLVRASIEIRGSPTSQLLEVVGGSQILRVENANGVRLSGFSLKGRGGQGTGLAHGILQVFGGSDIAIENVTSIDSDADGIVIADARRVSIRDCRSIRSSKSGLYLSRCVGGIVANNIVEDGVGHRTAQGALVGTGIQLSSNIDVACTGNVVRNGIGIGILLDANSTGTPPTGCAVVGNRIRGWRNTLNPDVSAGIRLQNSAESHATRSLVAANTIESCGTHGIYVENQDDVSVLGNTIVASDRSSICISTSKDVHVLSNVVLDPDAGNTGSQAGLHLINAASGVIAQGNRIESRATTPYVVAVRDQSTGSGNSIDTQQRRASAPPTSGLWSRGDVFWNTEPFPGAPLGWVCSSGGTPGVWSVLGRIE